MRSSLKPLMRNSAIGGLAVVLALVLAGCRVPLPSSQPQGMPNPFPSSPSSPSSRSPQSTPSPSSPSSIPSPPSLPSPSSSPLPSLPSPSLPSPSFPTPSLPPPSSPPSRPRQSPPAMAMPAIPASGRHPARVRNKEAAKMARNLPRVATKVLKPAGRKVAGKSATRLETNPAEQPDAPARTRVPKPAVRKATAKARWTHWSVPSANWTAKSSMSESLLWEPKADQADLAAMRRETMFPHPPLPNRKLHNRQHPFRRTNPTPGTMTWLRVNSGRRPWRKPTPNCASSCGKSTDVTSPGCEFPRSPDVE